MWSKTKDRYLEGRYFFDEWDKALRFRGLVKQQREQYRTWPDYGEALGAFEWKLPEDTHPDFFVGDMATWWLRSTPKKDPLFLQIGFPGPHPPYDPIPRYAAPYLEKDLPLMPVTQDELDALPPALKELRQHNSEVDHDSILMPLSVTDQQRQRQRAFYLANVTMIDEKVGEIMETLSTTHYADNSIVIFTSDHGDCLTDHGQSQKWTMYDQITRVPMIVWAPNRFVGGRSIPQLVQQMDIGPTILQWAGLDVPPELEASSVTDAFDAEPDFAGRPFVYCEQAKDGNLTGCEFMSMVRDQTHKVIHFLDEPHGQLFDLVADPDERDNLWDSPEHADHKTRLLSELREWRIRSGVHTKDWCQDYR